MLIEFVGKFYDNHSLSIVNRNIVLGLAKLGHELRIIALDSYDPLYNLDKEQVRTLKRLEQYKLEEIPEIQVRHSYPPIWEWPTQDTTKIVYMQPWEYPKALFEWQYKFETFADAVILPSNYCKNVFTRGGLNPNKIHLIPYGYDDTIFNQEPGNSVEHLGVNASKFNFIYVGNSQWRKGLDILLNSWIHSFGKPDNARLIIKDNPRIYGQSNILSEIVKIQYETDCAEIIYIDDELSTTEMADLYKASKVLVHPYRAEGFAMHVQEAAACGCLPIIPSKGPTDDFIDDDKSIKLPIHVKPINIQDPGIFALKPGDATTLMSTHTFINEPSGQHLTDAMRYIYNTHDKQAIMDKAKDISSLNTWESVVVKYIDVFNKISKRTPNRLKY